MLKSITVLIPLFPVYCISSLIFKLQTYRLQNKGKPKLNLHIVTKNRFIKQNTDEKIVYCAKFIVNLFKYSANNWRPDIFKVKCLGTLFIPNKSDLSAHMKTIMFVISDERVNALFLGDFIDDQVEAI